MPLPTSYSKTIQMNIWSCRLQTLNNFAMNHETAFRVGVRVQLPTSKLNMLPPFHKQFSQSVATLKEHSNSFRHGQKKFACYWQ